MKNLPSEKAFACVLGALESGKEIWRLLPAFFGPLSPYRNMDAFLGELGNEYWLAYNDSKNFQYENLVTACIFIRLFFPVFLLVCSIKIKYWRPMQNC